MEALNQALSKIKCSGLFSNIDFIQHPDEKVGGSSIYEIKLKEADKKPAQPFFKLDASATLELRRTHSSTFENRKIEDLTRSLIGSVTTSNLLNPTDNLSTKHEYVRSHIDGVYNPIFKTSIFSSSKLSPVFTGGPGSEEVVPPILVDRVGMKANITKNFIHQSEFTSGLGLEKITTRDQNSKICANGLRLLPSGGIRVDGPPTTLSGTGIDHMVFVEANITRDNTKFLNGATVGEKTVFQVDQGLGLGNGFPLFNRHQLTLTRFIQLKQVEEGSGNPQLPVLVLRGHYGGSIGDLPIYEAFVLGGPYSVRGYSKGELGAAGRILELGAEIRIPVKSAHVYAFAEHGNALGSSKRVEGNPTAVYGKRGHGSSYGLGVKIGQVRAEYAVDHNCGTGALILRFGERY